MDTKWLGMCAAIALLLAGCGSESFADSDPKGYEACSEWAGYVSDGGAEAVVGGSMAVAGIARESSTEEIRDSVSNLFDEETADLAGDQIALLDRKRFEAACADQGFDFN